MKYIALLIVLGFMGWTWNMAQADRDFGLAESREMENQIQDIITEYVKKDRPQAESVRFQQLFTEVVHPSREMRVHVRYVIAEAAGNGADSAEQMFQGIVILKSEDGKTWQMAGQDVRAPIVEFKNGAQVDKKAAASSGGDLEELHEEPETSEAPKAEAGHDDHH